MDKTRNTSLPGALRFAPIDPTTVTPLDARSLDARSLALSTLLGTHPPALPGRSLVGLADLFGIAGGTMRTALSRLVARGEVRLVDGRYELVGALLERQRSQDTGRRAPAPGWSGEWHVAIVTDDRRPVGERRRFRTLMAQHRFGELRPDIWMRPANLTPPVVEVGWMLTTGALDTADSDVPTARLWDLPGIAGAARRLLADLGTLESTLDWTSPDAIPPAFTSAATVVRFLRVEPMLPPALVGDDWPVDMLRARYDAFEERFQAAFRNYLGADSQTDGR